MLNLIDSMHSPFALQRLLFLGVLAGSMAGQTYHSPLTITDVSPDAPYGSVNLIGGTGDPGGEVAALALERNGTSLPILYAATPRAGVWKSTDGGQNWAQSSFGITFGMGGLRAADGGTGRTILAFDGNDSRYPERLLYAAINLDGRATPAFGGLYVSNDGARSWQHINLCPPANIDISAVLFSQQLGSPGFPGPSYPFVMTECGLFTTLDPSLQGGWYSVQPQGGLPFGEGALLAADAAGGIFACQGSVWESTDLGSSWRKTNAPDQFTGPCMAIAAAPSFNINGRDVIELTSPNICFPVPAGDCKWEVSLLTFGNANFDSRRRLLFPGDDTNGPFSGIPFVATLARSDPNDIATGQPGIAYDIIAADGLNFYSYSGVQGHGGRPVAWRLVQNVHDDTWPVVSGRYQPGVPEYLGLPACEVWLANDGGVFGNNSVHQSGSCMPESGYVLAEHGLHAFTALSISGIRQDQLVCRTPDPCPALYVASADNATWATTPQHTPVAQWGPIDGLGDSGATLVDPIDPFQVVSGRNGLIQVHYGFLEPPNPGDFNSGVQNDAAHFANLTPPNSAPFEPPWRPNFTLVPRVPGPAGEHTNTYLGVESVFGKEVIVIKQFGLDSSGSPAETNWMLIDFGLASFFEKTGAIRAIKAGFDPPNITVYALVGVTGGNLGNGLQFQAGHLYRGVFDPKLALAGGTTFSWTDVSGNPASHGIQDGLVLFVNPYDTGNLYVFDGTTRNIKVSFDAGAHWLVSQALTDIATQYGTFLTDCPFEDFSNNGVFANGCTLRNMYFDDANPNIQVAVLQPGGIALSRDHGQSWIDLDVTHTGAGLQDLFDTEPLQTASDAFYDDHNNPATRSPSLYIALNGAGVHRIDGPLDSLTGAQYNVRCDRCRTVLAVDLLNRLTIPLRPFPDGTFHTTELLNLGGTKHFTYRFEIDGRETEVTRVDVNDAASVIAITEACTKESADGEIHCQRQ